MQGRQYTYGLNVQRQRLRRCCPATNRKIPHSTVYLSTSCANDQTSQTQSTVSRPDHLYRRKKTTKPSRVLPNIFSQHVISTWTTTHRINSSGLTPRSERCRISQKGTLARTQGYASVQENTGVVHVHSIRQTMVTISSTEATTYAALGTTEDIVYFRTILEELSFPQLQPTSLCKQTISPSSYWHSGSQAITRCKHYLAHIHYMIEQVDKHVVTNKERNCLQTPSPNLKRGSHFNRTHQNYWELQRTLK